MAFHVIQHKSFQPEKSEILQGRGGTFEYG